MFKLLRHLKYGRCLVLLSVYMLGMVLGSAIMLSFDFKRVIFEPVRTARELPLQDKSSSDRIDLTRGQLTNEHISFQRKQFNSHLSLDDTTNYLDNSLHKASLFVAVLPSNFTNLEQVAYIYNTWGETVSNMGIFLPNTTNFTEFYEDSVFVRTLHIETFNRFPSISEISQVLRHLYDHYYNTFQYFLIISDLAYLNNFVFIDLINEIHSYTDTLLYTGLPVQFGRTKYCLGDAGVLINARTLGMLVEGMESTCIHWNSLFPWDKMLGQCARKTLSVDCANISLEKYFISDSLFQSLSPANLWHSSSPYSNAFTISPVNSFEHMNTLHYFFTAVQMKLYLAKAEKLRKSILASCEILTSYAFENEIVKNDCEKASNVEGGPLILRFIKKKPSRKWRRYHRPPSWKYFDNYLIYVDDKIDPCITYSDDHHTSTDIKEMSSLAETIIQEKYRSPSLKLQTILNGYIRQDLYRGNEYIIDAMYNNSEISVNERVRLLRPFLPSVRVEPAKESLQERVHVIVPISNVNSKCIKFVNLFISKAIKKGQNCHLVLVVYRKLDYESMKSHVSKIKYGSTHVSVVRGKGRFSRAKALHQGIGTLKSSDLIFFCDVDMIIDTTFYDRCRRNTIRGEQVYFPTVVKLYNPKFFQGTKPLNSLPLNRQTGHWATYGYGMLCIYKSDYLFAGGFNIRMRGWGGEDIDFSRRVTRKGLTIFRAPDKGLVHHWHERDCGPRYVRKSMRPQCLSSKIEALGDKRTLARFIFNITQTYPFLLKKGDLL